MIRRDAYLKRLIDRRDNGRIKVITGIRRCGKSVLLFDIYYDYLIESGVNPEQIITLKLDLAINARYRNPMELDSYVRKFVSEQDKRYYVMLDEIQEVVPVPNPWINDKNATIGFVDVILGLQEIKNVDLYVTGSNSKMLSSDILTEFKDRGDEIHINPLTYKEFQGAYNGNESQVWNQFVTYGGLPHILSEKTDSDKAKYLQDLIRKTYLTDVVERNKIQKDISVLDDLLNILASNVGSLTNPMKLKNTFSSVLQKKISDATISSYINFFCEAYMLRKAHRYDVKGKKYIGSPLKYYFADIGLRNAQLNFRQQEQTHLMENVIYNELCARGLNADVGVVEYNYKDSQGRSKRTNLEIDFVVNCSNNRWYIQSAFAINDTEKRLQETQSLRKVDDFYKKIVVVRDSIIPWHDEDGVYFIGIEDFLLHYIDENIK